ncbi:MAG: hypothetical protein ACOC16_00180 [Nanoarchaeota archaeon]
MEFELLNLKSEFLRELINEIQRVEITLWDCLKYNNKKEIPNKLDYMQKLILDSLKILNESSVEVALFYLGKTQNACLIEKELKKLYIIIEKQKESLTEIENIPENKIILILDANKSNPMEFSQSSQKISYMLSLFE